MGDHIFFVEQYRFGFTFEETPKFTDDGYNALVHALAPLLETVEQRSRFVHESVNNQAEWRAFGYDVDGVTFAANLLNKAIDGVWMHTLSYMMKRGYDEALQLTHTVDWFVETQERLARQIAGVASYVVTGFASSQGWEETAEKLYDTRGQWASAAFLMQAAAAAGTLHTLEADFAAYVRQHVTVKEPEI
ncbi:MAG: hypothetical protein J0L97_08635 [Alphaproteobacteria bacterium]|nr:hypothetical protein [Alphaproteobacteria bacterium]